MVRRAFVILFFGLFALTTPVRAASSWWVPVAMADVQADSGVPQWQLRGGLAVERGRAPDTATPPRMEMIAGAPGAPGVAVAAGHGEIWRRSDSGKWTRSLVLLPQSLFAAAPPITALAAFDERVSDSIYLATDGYGILITTDGGYSWVRDDLGLPDHVRALITNAKKRDLYAITNNGVWVHHLAAFPAPPVLLSGELLWHWIGILAVALASIAGGSATLRRACQ